MFNLQRHKLFLSVAIVPLVLSNGGISSRLEKPLDAANSPQLVARSWNLLFWLRRPRTRLGIRSVSSGACAVSPGLVGQYTLWHDRPTFVWHGMANQISVRDHENQTVLWTQSTNPSEQQASYSGQQPLQPGKLYQWQLLGAEASGSDRDKWQTFQVMPENQRAEITSELQTLEQQLKTKGNSKEEIVLQKANYFVDRNLWSDALQTLYDVENPSPAFVAQRQSYIANLCSGTPAAASNVQ